MGCAISLASCFRGGSASELRVTGYGLRVTGGSEEAVAGSELRVTGENTSAEGGTGAQGLRGGRVPQAGPQGFAGRENSEPNLAEDASGLAPRHSAAGAIGLGLRAQGCFV